MSPRPKLLSFPEEFREKLDAKVRAASYAGYVELAAWATAQGHPVGKSSLQRYGARLCEIDRQDGRQVARMVVSPSPHQTDV